tara:strand:- start:4895 stop:5659 length:765 start_codon:yes stop_codon:yes gene_type:complete
MNIILITPNEPFYLSKNISFLIKNIPKEVKLKGCVLLKPTPYGKRLSFIQKALKTFKIFGLNFFIYYSIEFLKSKFFKKDVKTVLEIYKIPIIELSENINHQNSINTLLRHNPDLIVSILANEIFKRPILDLPTIGCINLHTSLLPKYRGMMPTFWAMLNDENEIGISVFLMDEGIDTGPIIVQETIPVHCSDSQKVLIEKTKRIGMRLIISSIELIKSKNLSYIENNDENASYYSYPKKHDVRLFLKKGKKFF